MTHREWIEWIEYFNRNGRLDPIRMYDRGSAQLCSIVANALGGSGTVEDFLPYKPQRENPLASLDDVVKAFGMVKNGRSR
jgi:hypothetical protein